MDTHTSGTAGLLAGCGIPLAVGLAGMVHAAVHTSTHALGQPEEALVALAATGQAILLALGAAWTYRQLEPHHQQAVGLWTLGGWLHVGAVVTLLFLGQTSTGGRIVGPWITIHLSAMGGGLLGLFVGHYHQAHRRARERAEHLHRQLAVYLRLLRHDVRNDAQLIRGYADLIEMDGGRDGLDEIRSAARHVIQLTQLSQAFTEQDGTLRARALTPVLEDVVDALVSRFPEADLRIVDPAPEVHVWADEMLESAVENIAHNAIEHHDGDRPTVRIRVDADEDTVQIRIVDDGPGVPREERASLFATDPDRPPSESGIGLYLVASIVDRYGGEVELEDTGPEGSTFRVELVRAQPAQAPRPAQPAGPDREP